MLRLNLDVGTASQQHDVPPARESEVASTVYFLQPADAGYLPSTEHFCAAAPLAVARYSLLSN